MTSFSSDSNSTEDNQLWTIRWRAYLHITSDHAACARSAHPPASVVLSKRSIYSATRGSILISESRIGRTSERPSSDRQRETATYT